MKKIYIDDIREATYDANLDTEYREAMAYSLMVLGYISDSPLKLSFGTNEQKKEIKDFEERPLDSNQISEIIQLMMYQMRNDFQYERFKPVALKFLEISEKMKDSKQEEKESNCINVKLRCNICKANGNMLEIIGLASNVLKENNMINKSRKMIERATKTYSYDEALDIINEYVEIVKEKEKNSYQYNEDIEDEEEI